MVMAQAREHGFRVAMQACEDLDGESESVSIFICYSHHQSTCKGLLYDGFGEVFGQSEEADNGEDSAA